MAGKRQWVHRVDGVRQRYTATATHPAERATINPSDSPVDTGVVADRLAAAHTFLTCTPTTETSTLPDVDYRIAHQAPQPEGLNSMANLDDVLPDVVEHPEWYAHRQSAKYKREDPEASREEREAIAIIRAARDNPDLMVTIYRSAPPHVTTINPGDWVTTGPHYASANAYDEAHHILTMQVPASDLHNEGDLMEWGWNPPN